MAGITITDISRKHIRSFHSVLGSVSREKKYLSWTEAPPLRDLRAFVLNGIAKRSPQVVALDGRNVVGWCDITPHPRETTRHCGTLGMGLLAGYRGKGIGTELILAALERARARGLHRVELEVFEENEAAIALYKKVGFRTEGRKACAVRIDNTCINTLMMAILLDDFHGP